jgi:DME family drug/metabolite transporter
LTGELYGLASAFLWAVASVLIALGSKRLHVLPLNLVRCAASTAFFWALLPFYGGLDAVLAIPKLALLWLLVSVLALLVVGDTLYFRAMELAGVSRAMPVSSINPLWAVLLAALFVGEPLTWSLALGAILVVLGVILVGRPAGRSVPVTPGRSTTADEGDPRARTQGLILAGVVSVLWAVGLVALKPATAGIESVVANSVRQPLAMVLLLALTLWRGRWRDFRNLDRRSWAVILAAGFVGTGVATLFFIMSVQEAGAGRTAVLAATSPLMAIPFSLLWLGERPTRWTLAGTLLTTAGVILVV